MNKIYQIMFFLAFGFLTLQAGTARSLEEARALSAESGKPILMDFMTEW